jgi:carboxymethylenebutenolidase
MRRLALLGLGAPAATALLAAPPWLAASAAAAPPVSPPGKPPTPESVVWDAVATEPIAFPGPNGELLGAWAPAAEPRGAVLVIHENRGLNDHIRTVAGRLAGSDYSALALDLLSEEGGTGAFPGEAEVAAALSVIPPARFDADMQAAVNELTKRLPGHNFGAVGFCFGGGMVWRLLAAGESRLAAAAPFYGPFPEGGDLSGTNAAVLGVYGGLDARVNETMPTAKAALEAARLRHQIVTFASADHAFFNDTGARFNAAASAEVWHRLLDWFETFVR